MSIWKKSKGLPLGLRIRVCVDDYFSGPVGAIALMLTLSAFAVALLVIAAEEISERKCAVRAEMSGTKTVYVPYMGCYIDRRQGVSDAE